MSVRKIARLMAIRELLPRVAERLEKPVRLAANLLLLVAVLVLLAVSWQAVWVAAGNGSILLLLAFVTWAAILMMRKSATALLTTR